MKGGAIRIILADRVLTVGGTLLHPEKKRGNITPDEEYLLPLSTKRGIVNPRANLYVELNLPRQIIDRQQFTLS